MDIFVRTAFAIAKRDGIDVPAAISKLSVLPTQLSDVRIRGTIWDPANKTV